MSYNRVTSNWTITTRNPAGKVEEFKVKATVTEVGDKATVVFSAKGLAPSWEYKLLGYDNEMRDALVVWLTERGLTLDAIQYN